MPKVWNKRDKNCPKDAVYVGRPSKWGNPFKIDDPLLPAKLSQDEKRKLVIDEYRILAEKAIAKGIMPIEELRGKDLVCWCSPKPCHADVLLELANK